MQDKFHDGQKSDNDLLIDQLLREAAPAPQEDDFGADFEEDAASVYETNSADITEFEPPDPIAFDAPDADDDPYEDASEHDPKDDTYTFRPVPARVQVSESDLDAGEAVRQRRAEDSARKRTRQTAPARKKKPVRAAAQKPAPKKRKRRRKKSNLPFVLVWTTLMVAIGIVLSAAIIALGKDVLAIGKSGMDKIIVVESGSSTDDIAQLLYDEGIIRVPKMFKLMSRLKGADGSYVAGEHVVSAEYTYEQLIVTLTKPVAAETVTVTITEGTRLIDAAQQLEDAGVCDASRFIYFFNAGGYEFEFEDKLPAASATRFYKMEGYLFPDTYEFYVDMDPELACQKIYARFDEIMSEGVIEKTGKTYYETMEEQGYTLDQVVTLASIVQCEAPTMSSMQMVSSVFWNRLNNSTMFPSLQSDPTTKYVNEVIRPNISVNDETIFTAYDTYRGQGLPPGAICNPGKDAIEAVLNPATSKYYFFCANVDTKEIFYAVTNEEHEENLAKIKRQQSGEEMAGDPAEGEGTDE